MRTSQTWQLKCFGDLRVEREAQSIGRFRTQKTAALLLLLALCGKQSRERICSLLWPDTNPEAARNSLSVALSSLRRELGENILEADRQEIALVSGAVETDVREFDAALKNRDFAKAVEIYSGHFLPGFYEDPFPALAREYEEKARYAYSSRLDDLEKCDEFEAVFTVARRAIALFGNDGRWFLALMRAHYGLCEFDAALRVYETWGRHARKSGETTSETGRLLAKAIRRDKESGTFAGMSVPAPAPRVEVTPVRGQDVAPTSEKGSGDSFPTQWTEFFGREAEREVLSTWLRSGANLVTLTGAGGSGKTRLAIETVGGIAPEWDNTYFVSLASLADPDLLCASVRDALSLAPTSDASPLQQLERALAGQRAILVLDNFEHLVECGVERLQGLREKLPETVFVVTSRVLLNLPGEREFPVAPLPTPLQNTVLDEVRHYPSVALFCDRAHLTLDAENVEAVAALCRRLDGIPLALELAAARAKILSPAQILERVGGQPNFLQSREVGLPARHKTLRAAIAWSVELLPPHLHQLFTQLSLFRGGWDLEAVEEVCDAVDALDDLTQLRESSLIVVDRGADETRFRMLQTLREFGQEELQGEERARTERAFFAYFRRFAEQAASNLRGPQQKEWLLRLETELDNLRAAFEWARQNDLQGGLALATALIDFWETRFRLDEGRYWLTAFLEAVPENGDKDVLKTRARALSGIGRLAWYSSDVLDADTFLEQGLETARRANDPETVIYALRSLARVTAISGGYERACVLGRESVRLSRNLGDGTLLMESLIDCGFADLNVGHFETAATFSEEAIALARQNGDEHALCLSLLTLAIVLLYGERRSEVLALTIECESICRSIGAVWELASCLSLRANILNLQHDFEGARQSYEEALRLLPPSTLKTWNGYNILWTVVLSFQWRDEPENAVCLLGAIEALRESIGYTLLPFMVPEFEKVRAGLHKTLGKESFDWHWERGSKLTPEQAVECALNPPLVEPKQ